LCQRLEQFVQAGTSTEEMVDALNQAGFHPPKRRKSLNSEEVRVLIRRLGLGESYAPKAQAELAEHEWWLRDLAACLQMPTVTLYNWVQRGWVKARQQSEFPKHWIIWADESEVQRLKTHRQQPQGEILRQRWRGEVLEITRCPGSE
jgi:hypothetical protein